MHTKVAPKQNPATPEEPPLQVTVYYDVRGVTVAVAGDAASALGSAAALAAFLELLREAGACSVALTLSGSGAVETKEGSTAVSVGELTSAGAMPMFSCLWGCFDDGLVKVRGIRLDAQSCALSESGPCSDAAGLSVERITLVDVAAGGITLPVAQGAGGGEGGGGGSAQSAIAGGIVGGVIAAFLLVLCESPSLAPDWCRRHACGTLRHETFETYTRGHRCI